MMGIYIIFGVFALISWAVSANLQSKFKKYSKIPLAYGMTGREVAEKMLRDNGIYDVKVISTPGQLTDHYNPLTKTVNLSEGVYASNSVAAAAVAAHECGHAVQHATAYAPLTMRSKLVPVVSFASNWMQWVLLAGILMLETFPQLMLAGINLFATTTLFSFITLPVEINASSCPCLAKQRRHYQLRNKRTRPRCSQIGRIHLCGSCTWLIGHIGILHFNVFGKKRLIFFRQ
jgi:Zn-dependent membrane protease YugP